MVSKTKETPTGGFGDAEESAIELTNKYLALVEDVTVQDPAQVSRQIASRIMEQDSVDAILGMADSAALSAEDILERPFVILDRPSWHKAKDAYKDGTGVFVVLNVGMQDTGEAMAITCGGTNVLAQLYTMQSKGMLPNDVPMQFIQRATNAGFNVLWLAKAQQ